MTTDDIIAAIRTGITAAGWDATFERLDTMQRAIVEGHDLTTETLRGQADAIAELSRQLRELRSHVEALENWRDGVPPVLN